MVNKDYVPDRGDIIWLDFNPQKGKEQMGRRPALVISPKAYNKKVSLFLVVPITTKIKGYPFEVKLSESLKTKGVIISDQVKSLDWNYRNADYIEKIDKKTIDEVLSKLTVLLR